MKKIRERINPTRKAIHRRIFYNCCLALAFFIPISGRVLPPIIMLMVLNWLIEGSYLRNAKELLQRSSRKNIFLFSVFYFLYLVGMTYSENQDYGWFDLEIKFSLLLFPLIFSTMDISMEWKQVTMVLKAFVAGCLSGTLILVGHSAYLHFAEGVKDAFAYTNLSWLFHPSYLSMYLSFSIAILILALIEHWELHSVKLRRGMISMITWFFVFIIFLSSKAGFIGLFTVIIVSSLILAFKYRKLRHALGIIILSVLLFIGGLKIFPFASTRVIEAKQDITGNLSGSVHGNSTADRIGIWKAGGKIVQRNLFFGVGTGDVKDELVKEYKNDDVHPAFELRLNAHDQYLQTMIALGIPGLITLLLSLFLPLVSALKQDYYLYVIFLLVFMTNILVEAMLEIQQGVIYYAFFNTFLFWSMSLKPKDNK